MRKIMIIGAGGIGSFLVSFLDRIGLYDITIYDDDLVENKNLTYQNYGLVDVGDKKVDAIVRKSSNVTGEPYFVLVKEQLANYDLVVCCADNLAVRRLLYKEGHGEDCRVAAELPIPSREQRGQQQLSLSQKSHRCGHRSWGQHAYQRCHKDVP